MRGACTHSDKGGSEGRGVEERIRKGNSRLEKEIFVILHHLVLLLFYHVHGIVVVLRLFLDFATPLSHIFSMFDLFPNGSGRIRYNETVPEKERLHVGTRRRGPSVGIKC